MSEEENESSLTEVESIVTSSCLSTAVFPNTVFVTLFPTTAETLATSDLAILMFCRVGGQSRCVIGRTKVTPPLHPASPRR